MNIPKKTKRNTLILSSSISILLLFVGYLFLKVQFQNSIDEKIKSLHASTKILFDLNIEEYRKIYSKKLKQIVSQDAISRAVAKHDYNQLNSVVSPYYKEFKEFNSAIEIMTFRDKSGLTLYRAHRPEFHGDTISHKRKMIVTTNKMHKPLTGFEVGKIDMIFRIVEPIFYNGEYVGSAELGIDPVDFMEHLKYILNIDIALVVDKSLVDIMINSHYSTKKFNDQYMLIYHEKKFNKLFITRPDTFRVNMSIPLKNFSGDILGYMLEGFDTSKKLQQNQSTMKYMLIFMTVLTLFLWMILQQGFNSILKHFIKQSRIDKLTGLYNREALNAKILPNKNYVLIISNIKEFRLINEFYGMQTGNKVLKEIAHVFSQFNKYQFEAFHISADEFVLLKKEDEFNVDGYIEILKELHSGVNACDIYIDTLKESVNVEIYSGVAHGASNILGNADMALKHARKNTLPYLAYSEHIDTTKNSENIIKVKGIIQNAIKTDNVVPFFQPITNVHGEIIKYEALMRIVSFEHKEKKILTPNIFLDISLKSGLYVNLTTKMLEQALSLFSTKSEKISINFLPNDFFNPHIMKVFLKFVNQFDSPEKIVVEIVEQEGIEDFEKVMAVIKKIRSFGVSIAIDDFGSGYTNYSYVLAIKPDYLKIDGSLVKNLLTNEESRILVKSIVNFTKELGIKTIAEYVENKEIFELLKEYGVDEFQGYYFGKPLNLLDK